MNVRALSHYTLNCTEAALPKLVAFYTQVIGLVVGDRPIIPFPGHWLYSRGLPLVHLAAVLARDEEPGTGTLDHVAFEAVDLCRTRERLRSLGVMFHEAPVPGWPLHQIFLRDPIGLKVELTFSLDPS